MSIESHLPLGVRTPCSDRAGARADDILAVCEVAREHCKALAHVLLLSRMEVARLHGLDLKIEAATPGVPRNSRGSGHAGAARRAIGGSWQDFYAATSVF
ncbi:MAG TPA: hypothetical protein VIC29_09170 [Steroidobacteraceae bacterium]